MLHPLLLLALLARAAAHRCWPGTTPGTWRSLEHGQLPDRQGNMEFNRLDDSRATIFQLSAQNPSILFGSNWVSVEAACPLSNLLQPHLRGEQDAVKATILLLGDSVDAYHADFLCLQANVSGVAGWKAFVHSHGVVNYCLLPSGLNLLQIYLFRRTSAEDFDRIASVARLFSEGFDDTSRWDGQHNGVPRSVLDGRAEELAFLKGTQPDLVVTAAAYWPLQALAGGWTADGGVTPPLLPADVIESYQSTTVELLAKIRQHFPFAQLAVHTSSGLWTDDFGNNVAPPNSPRIWGRKSYFAQLNAALRATAAAGHAKVVDLEAIAAQLTYGQLTGDNLHPRSFFCLEVVNLYVQMVSLHRHEVVPT